MGAPDRAALDLVARKAVARSISDVAAMAGVPRCALATACLPRGYPQWAAEFLADAIHRWGERWDCPVVGGDVASGADERSPIVLTVTVMGTPHATRGPVLRSGARAGDGAYVTGLLGGSLASGRHLTFEPRVAAAAALADELGAGLTAMIDLSDGLGRDAGRVAEMSRARIVLDAAGLPCHGGCSWMQAIGDGEDYELFFTASGEVPASVAGTAVTRVGEVVAGSGAVVVTPEGEVLDAGGMGFDH